MTAAEIRGWNAALAFLAAWLQEAILNCPPEYPSTPAVLGEVLNICLSERK